MLWLFLYPFDELLYMDFGIILINRYNKKEFRRIESGSPEHVVVRRELDQLLA